ncbi:hypothetical protein AVEN_224688-1 [Araneus ventricosus]|uniref:Uncharacterized protein n=1 Tax=Araneus ventricosus TaxID=182803 RepID=A0A4Y2LQ13_ARAVE|nr:hypothetical protein AVEN_224688-1 [Araneus ventricosus]
MKLYYDAHGKKLVTEREIVHLDDSDYIVLERYRARLDEYRLPLETLEYSQQMKECSQWVERIVTLPEVNVDREVQLRVESSARRRKRVIFHERFDSLQIAESVLPQGRDGDAETESYTLLLLMLQFRSMYEERGRGVVKYFAIFTALSFLWMLHRRQELRKRMAKVVRWTLVAAACSLALAVWMQYF